MENGLETTEAIWQHLSSKLRGYLLKRVSDKEVAEDLLQEVFIRIHKNLATIEDKERIQAWVFQIARNIVIDYHRSNGRSVAHTVVDLSELPYDEQDNFNEFILGWLPSMVAKLPETYREAVELYELKGVSQQKIADQLGLSLSAAKSRIQRGREKLKSILFDCCSFEQDRRGNVIACMPNSPEKCGSEC